MSTKTTDTANSPHILILGMGGTIAGLASNPSENPLQYEAGQLGVDTLLSHLKPGLPEGIQLISRQLANINSRNLSEDLLTQLGNAVRESLTNTQVSGIVITHGTDTLEETGVFLQATCSKLASTLGKRVVLTGAMLPANAPGADGPKNLMAAILWAATPLDNAPGGVYGVFAGQVCLAADLAKRHSSALHAPIQDSSSSPMHLVNPSWLSMVRETLATFSEDFPIPAADAWPWVEILTSHAGAREVSIAHWLKTDVRGLVIAGSGLGGFHDAWKSALGLAAEQGIAIVRTTRTGAGSVYPNIPEKDEPGFAAAGKLSSPKARIALQLALNAAHLQGGSAKSLTWQDFFARIAVLPEIR
jgi:L-asparaginase